MKIIAIAAAMAAVIGLNATGGVTTVNAAQNIQSAHMAQIEAATR